MDPSAQRHLQSIRLLRSLGVLFLFSCLTRTLGCLLVTGSLVCLALLGRGESQTLSEYQIKAAFLYNFAKFVDWPDVAFPDPAAPLVLGVLGQDPFGPELEQITTGKTVNNRPLVIKRFASLQELEHCHILFISPSESTQLSQIVATLKGQNMLIVSETEQFLTLGGMLNFVTVDNQVRFEINQSAVERAGLKLSAKLLSLAIAVKTGN